MCGPMPRPINGDHKTRSWLGHWSARRGFCVCRQRGCPRCSVSRRRGCPSWRSSVSRWWDRSWRRLRWLLQCASKMWWPSRGHSSSKSCTELQPVSQAARSAMTRPPVIVEPEVQRPLILVAQGPQPPRGLQGLWPMPNHAQCNRPLSID